MREVVHDLASIERSSMPEPNTGCWLWLGTLDNKGYGRIGRGSLAHRVAYELVVGPIPEGLELDHLCRTPACCNPAHLDPVTHAENMRRGAWGRRSQCKNGHPFAGPNATGGRRVCRQCAQQRNTAYERRLGIAPRRILTAAEHAHIVERIAAGVPRKVLAAELGVTTDAVNRVNRVALALLKEGT